MASEKSKTKKAKLELPSITSTVATCAGCEEELDLLKNHLKVTVKTARQVAISQPVSEYMAVVNGKDRKPEDILAAGNVDVEEDSVSYLGERTGAGSIHRFHDFACLADYANERVDKNVELRFFRAGKEHYETVGRSAE